jgi:hypothetical protein
MWIRVDSCSRARAQFVPSFWSLDRSPLVFAKQRGSALQAAREARHAARAAGMHYSGSKLEPGRQPYLWIFRGGVRRFWGLLRAILRVS